MGTGKLKSENFHVISWKPILTQSRSCSHWSSMCHNLTQFSRRKPCCSSSSFQYSIFSSILIEQTCFISRSIKIWFILTNFRCGIHNDRCAKPRCYCRCFLVVSDKAAMRCTGVSKKNYLAIDLSFIKPLYFYFRVEVILLILYILKLCLNAFMLRLGTQCILKNSV